MNVRVPNDKVRRKSYKYESVNKSTSISKYRQVF